MDTTHIINQTRTWVESVVIGHNLCPFAKREYDRDSIRYFVNTTDNLEETLTSLILACQQLDNNGHDETALFILTRGFETFEIFLDLVDLAEALLTAQGYEGIYQLASFHPDYCFADTAPDDPANYTNRSPYPMLHLIREASIEAALQHYPNPDNIPERNCQYARELGSDVFKQLLADCIKSTD